MANRFEVKEVGSPKKRTSFLDKDPGGALKKKLIRFKVSWEASLRLFSPLLCRTLFAESFRSSGLVLFEGPSRRAAASFVMNSPRSISSATVKSMVMSALLSCVKVSVLATLIKQLLGVSLLPFARWVEDTEDPSQVLFQFPTRSYPQLLNHKRLSPNQHIH